MSSVRAQALPGLPEIRPGDDLAELIVRAAAELRPTDVVVVSHKVVSKAAGRLRRLADVQVGQQAGGLAAALGKDPRVVQVILDESVEVLRADRGVLVCRTRHGFVCANAGVDASNVSDVDEVVLLPLDADAAARRLRRALPGRPAVVIADSFGRAWRHGQTDVAIGVAGLRALDDWRGRPDAAGRTLRATVIAIADQAAGAADLARSGKASGQPVVVLSGLDAHVTADDGPGAAALVRPADEDLFR